MKRKVLGVLFTAMCLCAVPSAAYAEAQEAETTEAAGEAADEPEAGAETVTELSDSLYDFQVKIGDCLLYTSPSPRDRQKSRMPSSA